MNAIAIICTLRHAADGSAVQYSLKAANCHYHPERTTTTNDSPPSCEFAAYHEAGHVVMARQLGIRVDKITLADYSDLRHASRFASLQELYRLDSPNYLEIRPVVRKYVRFLLAGPAAVLLATERRWGHSELSPQRSSFRHRWLQRRFSKNDADIDVAYSLVVAWLTSDCRPDFQEHFQAIWTQTVETLECATLRKLVDRVATRLIRSRNTTSA